MIWSIGLRRVSIFRLLTCVYMSVVFMFSCPGMSRMSLRSVPCSSKCVANAWRRLRYDFAVLIE
jgi:hypothetical protein